MKASNDFESRLRETTGTGSLEAVDISTIQANVGLRCDLACTHCHLGASPLRTEAMRWETMLEVLAAARRSRARTVDITGGAPELNPDFRQLVEALSREGYHIITRTGLTVFQEPGMDDLPEFYRDHGVHLIASLPCYLEENVDAQRGRGVHESSIASIRRLNRVGYGRDERLELDLVYNPTGPSLPPDQKLLEEEYRRRLGERHGIHFTRLLTLTNMPIGRFRGHLGKENRHRSYSRILRDAYNPGTLDGLMCRLQVSVRWDGTLFDCDFNLALRMSVGHGAPDRIGDFDPETLARRRIVTGEHCFGCTAGSGSSCGGALVTRPVDS